MAELKGEVVNSNDVNAVIDKLNSELGKLAPLAAKVWEIYVRQQYVIGIQELFGFLFFLVPAVASLLVLRKALSRGCKTEDDQIMATVAIIFGLVAFGASLLFLQDAMAHFINPDYYAIQGILNH